ncbi:MAG: preprotein translocase subunit SecG [Candidatus Krumholzibacteriia bacterium]
MYTLVLILHIVVSLVLMVVVLLQSSKGGGLAGAFGGSGGAPQQILGTRGMTTLLHKVTIYCGAAFFVTSFLLFTLTGERGAPGGSVVQDAARRGDLPASTETMPAPATDVFTLPGTQAPEETPAPPATGGGEGGAAGERSDQSGAGEGGRGGETDQGRGGAGDGGGG